MKFFIDTADLEEIREAHDMGVLDGVTTNPSLMKKASQRAGRRLDFHQHIFDICELVDGDVSAEVTGVTYAAIMEEAKALAAIHSNVVVKVPLILDGIKAINSLSKLGIKVNCTLCFSPTQALIAAKAGATYISPFLGRVDDMSADGMQLLQEVVTIYANYGLETQILAASIRHPVHVVKSALMGAHVATMPLGVIKKLLLHPLTDRGLKQFLTDWDQYKQTPPVAAMEFIPLGSSTDIGASCHYIGCNGHGVVVDAGADPNHEGPDSLPKLAALKGRHVEHAIITHAHHDHIGGIPEVYERFRQVAFHMTEATRTLTEMMLYASARLQRRRYTEGSSQHRPLFDEEDVDAAIQSFVSHPYERPHALGSTDMEVNLHYSGHLLGSAGALLTDANGRRVFYTSDTNLNAQTIIPGGRYPKQVDVLISECTLGADPVAETVTRKSEERRFLKRLQAVLDRDGTVLVPVFMLGRAQEILAMLGQFRRSGRLDPEVPIYTAGGLRNVSRIYDATRYDTPRLDPDFEVSCVEQRFFPRSYKAKRRALREPSIHVLSSGMMIENTLSNWAANQIVENEKHAVFLVGFAKEDLPAGQLLQAAAERAESVVLDRRIGPKVLACEVERFRFSGHSSRQDLLGLIDAMNPGKVVLVHGETAARDWMIAQLADRQPRS